MKLSKPIILLEKILTSKELEKRDKFVPYL